MFAKDRVARNTVDQHESAQIRLGVPGVFMASWDLDALWTVAEAAGHAGVSEATVRSWVFRGHLAVAVNHDGQEIRDAQGRPRFNPLDVARAEFRTRERARRSVNAA
jgi:hypothetical protein